MKEWLFAGLRKENKPNENDENKEKKEKISARSYMYARYLDCIENCPVEEKTILLESQRGNKLEDNIRILIRELCEKEEYQEYKIYVSCEKKLAAERQDYFKWCGLSKVKVVVFDTDEYYKLLATAKYLVNDGNFFGQFIKRKEQVYLKVWNRIAIYPLGKSLASGYGQIGNIQKNLFTADYIMCSNELTLNRLAEDYMIANFGQSKVMFAGRLQNDELFDETYRNKIRGEYHLEDKQVICYYPVVRNNKTDSGLERNAELLLQQLEELDVSMTDSQVMFVSLPYEIRERLDFKRYKHILPVPWAYRRYQLLSASDLLITDNYDLMLDYAVTGKKQILYSFDSAMTITDATVLNLRKELPYPKAETVENVICEINSGISYDDTALHQKYCRYTGKGMAELVCRKFILNQDNSALKMGKVPDNGKKNVLIYPGTLVKNGITASIISLLEHLDREKYNYMILFRTEAIKEREECLRELPEGVSYYGYTKYRTVSSADIKKHQKWQEHHRYPYAYVKETLRRRTLHERERLLDALRIDDVIQYDGYGQDMMMLFEQMPCAKTIYVHNDMVQEIKEKKTIRKEILSRVYQNYDNVAIVSEEQRAKTELIASYVKDKELSGKVNIVHAKNVINYERVLKLVKEPFRTDAETLMNVSEERLQKILRSNKKKFVTIGRFSKEKGHLRLMDAFEKIHRENPDTCLIILGGYGNLFEETMERAAKSEAKDAIVIIQYLSNPYALLKLCDYFVLSSFYEGLPVVLTEADLVGLPCFSTDIPGPRAFMNQYGGMLVENSVEGIVDGMKKCLSGNVPAKLQLDYEQYNREAVELFESMLQ